MNLKNCQIRPTNYFFFFLLKADKLIFKTKKGKNSTFLKLHCLLFQPDNLKNFIIDNFIRGSAKNNKTLTFFFFF